MIGIGVAQTPLWGWNELLDRGANAQDKGNDGRLSLEHLLLSLGRRQDDGRMMGLQGLLDMV